MHPEREIVCADRQSDGISTRPDSPNIFTHQSAGTNDTPRDPLLFPVTPPPPFEFQVSTVPLLSFHEYPGVHVLYIRIYYCLVIFKDRIIYIISWELLFLLSTVKVSTIFVCLLMGTHLIQNCNYCTILLLSWYLFCYLSLMSIVIEAHIWPEIGLIAIIS